MVFDPITAGIALFDKILEKVIPDANLRQETARELAQQNNSVVLAQLSLNQIDAASPSMLKAGWRPATGWICVISFAYQTLVCPIAETLVQLKYPAFHMTVLNDDVFMTVLYALLGLGVYRTAEKIKGALT